MGRLYTFAGFMIVLAGMMAVMAGSFTADTAPAGAMPVEAASLSARSDSSGDSAGQGKMTVERDGSGQFHIDAAVNGEDARFLVDTGADVVALGPDEAERLGVAFDPASFTPIMQTASGTGRGVVTTIDRLDVGGKELRDVPVAVIDGLKMNLLGQSALRRLGRVSMAGDLMTIGS